MEKASIGDLTPREKMAGNQRFMIYVLVLLLLKDSLAMFSRS